MARSHSVVAWCGVLGVLVAANLYAAEKKPATRSAGFDNLFAAEVKPVKRAAKKLRKSDVGVPLPQRSPAENEAAINAALASVTQMDFQETPLNEAIDQLKEFHKIEIQLDVRALSDAGIGSDMPVTKRLSGISLRSALNLMLGEIDLTWIVRDEVLYITTPEEAENQLTTKLYDVADLVACHGEREEPWEDYNTLIEIITTTVKPTTWDDVGGPGSVCGATLSTAKMLVVSQTREVHDEVTELLGKIRSLAAKNPNAGVPRRTKPTAALPKRARLTEGPTTPAAPQNANGAGMF